MDIGTGPWDRQWRPSEAKLDRILQINPQDVRREGAILDAGRFSAIAAALQTPPRLALTAPLESPPLVRRLSATIDSCVSVQVDGHRWLVAIGIPTPLSQWPI